MPIASSRVSSQQKIRTFGKVDSRFDSRRQKVQTDLSGGLTHPSIGRILFVDKDIDIRKVMESLLKIDQFQVVIMASAEEGLEQLEVDDPFDFVISGYTLHGMNGLRFLSRVAELYQKSVRILTSGGFADSDEISLAISDGRISRYVSKPFLYSTFRKSLRRMAINSH